MKPSHLLSVITLVLGQPAGAADDVLKVDLGGGSQLSLKLIPAGTFTQGSPPAEAGRSGDETAREVTLTRPFYFGVWPVTVGQFTRFADETRYRTEAETGSSGGFGWNGSQLEQRKEFTWRNPGLPQKPDHPVTLVTWNDAKEFCRWLGRKSGRQFTLPTEAQWEYACRAGTATAYPTGDEASSADAWAWHRDNSNQTTHPCGQKEANAWGLFDMGGNVWEWCEDWFGPYPPGPVLDPLQTNANVSDRPRRVLRGGSWLKDVFACRSAARFRNDPRSRNADNGFRIVTLTIEAPPPQPTPAPATIPESSGARSGAPATPAAQPSSTESRGIPLAAWLCFLTAIGIVGFIVFRVIGSLKSRGVSGAPAPKTMPLADSAAGATVRTRPANDGFWIEASVPAGTPIAWRCEAGGKVYAATVGYQPGPDGQFIFIGQPPSRTSALVAGTTSRVTRMPTRPSNGVTNINRGFAAGSILNQIEHEEPPPLPASGGDYPPAYQ